MLDWKYHDILNTVTNYLKALKRSRIADQVDFFTIHASNSYDCLKNLVETRNKLGLNHIKFLAITLLTSVDEKDSYNIYYDSPKNTVLNLANIAKKSWIDWVVCSSYESSMVREVFWDDFLIMTPWIRFFWDDKQEQKRVSTPLWAINSWANHLVMGRSIYRAEKVFVAIKKALDEIDKWKYAKSSNYDFEKLLISEDWENLLKYIWVIYSRKPGWKYCRLTSWLISDTYMNIWVLERYPILLKSVSLFLREKLVNSGIFEWSNSSEHIVIWSQMWSVRLSAFLSLVLWSYWTSIYTEKWWEKDEEMLFKRHVIDLKWKKVILSEDIIMAWSTIAKMYELVKSKWAEIVAITCIWNRSWKEEFKWVPILDCFKFSEFKNYWDEETPVDYRWNYQKIENWALISKKAKNEWDELILSTRNI